MELDSSSRAPNSEKTLPRTPRRNARNTAPKATQVELPSSDIDDPDELPQVEVEETVVPEEFDEGEYSESCIINLATESICMTNIFLAELGGFIEDLSRQIEDESSISIRLSSNGELKELERSVKKQVNTHFEHWESKVKGANKEEIGEIKGLINDKIGTLNQRNLTLSIYQDFGEKIVTQTVIPKLYDELEYLEFIN